jgi:D-sedoheptulose 7-phosphate isomerase
MMSRDWLAVLEEHRHVVDGLAEQAEVLEGIVAVLVDALRRGRRVYTFGNGGSAADAQHIACELLGRFKRQRRALPVMALSTDTSTLTAIANDYRYEDVFARQLEGLVQAGDVVWALSTSGNSPNVLAALNVAQAQGATIVGFSGQTGGKMAAQCRYLFRAPHTSSDRIQEAHLLAYHYVCERVEALFA